MLSDVWYEDFDWELASGELLTPWNTVSTVEADTTDSTLSESSIDSEKGKKRNRSVVVASKKRKKDGVPRVLFQDIRKCYHKMWFNCLNSGDLAMLYGFLDTFSVPDSQMTITRYGSANPEDKLYRMNVLGLEEMVKYFYCVSNLSPDFVMSITETTVQHTTGKVTSKMHKESTMIYEDLPNNPNYWAPYILIEDQYSDICPWDRDFAIGKPQCNDVALLDKRQTIREIMKSVDTVISRLHLRMVPAPMSIDGECTITTDEYKRIVKMECSAVVSRR